MDDLKNVLNVLYELNELRDRAKELREQGRRSLKGITNTGTSSNDKVTLVPEDEEFKERWISSGNNVEAALLVKVLNHRDLSEDDNENIKAEASTDLKNRLKRLKLENLFPHSGEAQKRDEDRGKHTVPVLLTARAMQALVSRSETVFSKATMLCYYRIVRELYSASRPDWTIGAARAGMGGNTSAFITGECIRAIFAFEDAIKRTATFFKQTSRLHGRHELLNSMFGVLKSESQAGNDARTGNMGEADNTSAANNEMRPLNEWADGAIERMWFDWYISTNPRHGNMALHLGEAENQLLFHPTEQVDMRSVGEYLSGLRKKLRKSVQAAKNEIIDAKKEIHDFRNDKQGDFFEWRMESGSVVKRPRKDSNGEEPPDYEKKLQDYNRAESAHQFAFSLIEKAESEVEKAAAYIENNSIKDILDEFNRQFKKMSYDVHRVLEPAKRYIRTVLYREVASTAFGRFDAGELVFAAASFGAVTDWKPSELLTRACALLIETMPESGRLPTTRPFQSTLRGHRMLPIGCEMTRSLAQLLQKTNYEFEPKLVRRMLNIFEERLIPLDSPGQNNKKKRVAWNFDGSPDPNRPSVWVTSVSIIAIDRIVRMLNERINSIIFKYFEVIRPEKPHTSLTLNDLVYPDHGLNEYHQPSQPSMAIRLEQMRAHVMRVTLPEIYKDERREREKVFSAIFYGPPGTGKTTLVEALALSSNAPLVRLSPSDLVVQGSAEIEGRARTVFEALSMLTQVVIILDEFDVVVGRRGQPEADKIFEFLRTGMLPKLVKLHDSARKQSLVYCLATNFFAAIDPAAKRKGRFDLPLPVYDPDPLSRVGTLLYRLWRVVERLSLPKDGGFSPSHDGMLIRFIEVVEMTSNTRASSLAEDYLRLPEWVIHHDLDRPDNYEEDITFFWYILKNKDEGYKRKKELLEEEKQKTQEEQSKASAQLSEIEVNERAWLKEYEYQLKEMLDKVKESSTKEILSCLIGPGARAAASKT